MKASIFFRDQEGVKFSRRSASLMIKVGLHLVRTEGKIVRVGI